MRKGFTLLEIIFVIIILGIIASTSSEVLVNITESYLLQKSKHNSTEKVELAIEQISNRLLYRINLSLRGTKVDGSALPLINITPSTTNSDDYVGIEWISYDNDGFESTSIPGWSGFIDLSNSSFSKVKTTGSNLDLEKEIMKSKTGSDTNGAIIFVDSPTYKNDGTEYSYRTECLYKTNGCIFPVTLNNNELTFTGGDRTSGDMIYSEFYQLVSSANTIIPEKDGDKYNLYLYSNYQPWLGEKFSDGDKTLLAKNISVFRFIQENTTIRVKICVKEKFHKKNIISCREKAVIR